jgi:hypothetical protein
LLTRFAHILLVLSLILEPVVALAQTPPDSETPTSNSQIQTPQDPLLDGIVIRRHPSKPGVIQAMKKSMQPGQAPLILNMSFNDDGVPQIQISGGSQVSLGDEQNTIQQKLFEHQQLIDDLTKNPNDENKAKISNLIGPELNSISNKVIEAIPEKTPLSKTQKIKVYGGKILTRGFVAIACLSLVIFPIWAMNAHLDSTYTLSQDLPMFMGTTFYEAFTAAVIYGLLKLNKKHTNWSKNLEGPPTTLTKEVKKKVGGALSTAKSVACNIMLRLQRSPPGEK